ncbi:hypothetical protein BABINDRAFT_163823 [Babjeviella inositovora NRRL Y-12698]|uniref:Uncharacterized protein n=1 Tax=Babjeviella inositovora NRRL Y-12698 TaxID=984486 RepID=A0A1E3QHB8_9ASCO|nr:uncharacterized protein BABINDRAFT_163823 [Babjeviella inositovora NRRL Y-12698]ODQ77089.1 hypothetical protein BABINDRAFT_163823 [Babjeviella inositovora NRRL Y-12698]
MSRLSSVYRVRNPPSSVRRQTGQKEDTVIPRLDLSEITLCLQSLEFVASEELLLRPTAQYVRTLYDQVIDLFMGISPEAFNRKVRELQQSDPGPDDIEFVDESVESFNLILLQKIMFQFLSNCGFHDFNVLDLVHPDPQRLQRITSAVVNFARFREEHILDCEPFLTVSEENLERFRRAQEENVEIVNKINELEGKLQPSKSKTTSIDKINEYNSRIENELKKLKKVQEMLTMEHANYKNEKINLLKKLEDHNYLMIEAKKNLDKIKGYLLERPEVLIKINEDLQNKLDSDSSQLAILENRLRDYSATIESFQIVEQDLRNLFKILEEILNDLNKEELNLNKLNKFQELHDLQSISLSNLNRKLQQITRQLTINEDKIQRTKKQAEEKRASFQSKMEELHSKYATLVTERDLNDQDLEKKKQYILNLEHRMNELQKNYNTELKETNLEIERLNNHLKLYLSEMEKKVKN